ncbi:MAG: hypothetical protein ABJN35_06000 [Erythrobacter sp.]
MPSMSLQTYAAWSNYHLTVGETPTRGLPPAMTIEHMRRFHCADVDECNPSVTMSDTAGTVMHALFETQRDTRSRWGPRPDDEIAAGIVGRGWSFSSLIGTPFAQLMAEGLAWIAEFPEDMRTDCAKDMNLCLCGGGTRLRELVSWAEGNSPERSILTSGTHLGPTVAGTFGTASHGSRLGRGGFQNLIHGMHVIAGDDRHIWLQRKSNRVMNAQAIKKLVAQYTYLKEEECPESETGGSNGSQSGCETDRKKCCKKPEKRAFECIEIADDEHFENALIHLGCMGVINAVAVELTDVEKFNVMGWAAAIDRKWIEYAADGKFHDLAKLLAEDAPCPEFYELTFDPFRPYREPAAHVFYFKTNEFVSAQQTRPTLADTISLVAGGKLFDIPGKPDLDMLQAEKDVSVDPPGADINRVLALLLNGQTTLLKAYIEEGCFQDVDLNCPKGPKAIDYGQSIGGGTWGEIHPDEISGGIPGALYNASYAIDRKRLPEAVDAITKAVEGLAPSFLFTIRFVDNAAGNLSFTHFKECAVIEIDGLSRHICDQTIYYGRQENRRGGHFTIHMEAALDLMASTVERGAEAVKRALTGAGIDFSMHWAKLGNIDERGLLDAKKVRSDFGPAKIESWRDTRCKLLKRQGELFFRNSAAEGYGLLPNVAAPCARPDPC